MTMVNLIILVHCLLTEIPIEGQYCPRIGIKKYDWQAKKNIKNHHRAISCWASGIQTTNNSEFLHAWRSEDCGRNHCIWYGNQ